MSQGELILYQTEDGLTQINLMASNSKQPYMTFKYKVVTGPSGGCETPM